MLKPFCLTVLLCSVSLPSFAELVISEKIRPNITSLVNPEIQRLAIPPTPNNMSLPEFGRGIIGWGTGPEGAEARLNNITAADVAQFKNQGVTLSMLETWHQFYANETRRNAGNPTAPLRAALMQKIISLW